MNLEERLYRKKFGENELIVYHFPDLKTPILWVMVDKPDSHAVRKFQSVVRMDKPPLPRHTRVVLHGPTR